MIDQAVWWVRRHPLAIFPCHSIRDGACSCGKAECGSPGKHPRTRRGVHDSRYADEDRIRAWWGSWPDANIGLATGEASGLYVVDLDGPEGLSEWWAVSARHGGAPQTMTTLTGGGGRHLFFRLAAGQNPPNTAKRLGEHIDTRGKGGYVLVPPSNHRSGSPYSWLVEIPPAPLPAWILDVVSRRYDDQGPRPFAVRALNDDDLALRILEEEASGAAHAPNGRRNDALYTATFKAATLAWGGEMTVETVGERMREAGIAAGLPRHEAEATVLSAVTAARETPRRIRTRKEGAL